ncbi:MAG: TolC family outer membrane protein, partial [Rickettsiales bacterium]
VAAAIGGMTFSPLLSADAHALSLKETLEQAYKFNPVIKSEREALGATDEGVSQAISEWRPTVSADYVRGRQKISFGGAAASHSDKVTKQLSIEQPIFDGMGSVARYRSAKFQVMAGRAQLESVVQDILLQAITAYMDVVRDTAVLDLSTNNVGVLGKQLQASRDRFEVGEVTRTDVAQSEARSSRAKSEEAEAQGALEASRAIFKRVIGADPDALDVAPSHTMPEVPGSLQEALDIALEENPVLLQANYMEDALDKLVDSQKSGLLPSVALTGSLRREQGAGVSGGNDFDNDVVAVNVSVPLYQSGAQYSRVRTAKKDREEAKYNAIDARNETVEEVTRAWQSLKSSTASIEANRKSIEAAEIALDGVKQEQQYGARTVLDVLDAEQELFAARVNLVRAERNEKVAAYTLLAAMGRLTPEQLSLDVQRYDPQEHYDRVKYKPIGF